MQILTLGQPPSTNPKQTSMIPLPRQYHCTICYLQVAPNRPTVNPPPNKNLGIKLSVAYQGVPGAFSEAATKKAYPDCELIACNQFDHVCKAVETCSADHAMLPLENSTGGSVHTNYDLLLSHHGLHIVGEVNLAVHHCLVALPGVEMKSIRRVISHAQALAQCNNTLTSLGATLTREPVANTAWAAEHVAKNCLRDTAAVASTRAAELYGLNVLADGIQDDPRNVTRFVALAREPHPPSITNGPNYKTSIVFASDKGASSLFKILSLFALRNINVTKIETRPHRSEHRRVDSMGEQFEYVFYIDLEASLTEARMADALDEMKKMTSFMRVLGSYPMDMSSWSPARGNKG